MPLDNPSEMRPTSCGFQLSFHLPTTSILGAHSMSPFCFSIRSHLIWPRLQDLLLLCVFSTQPSIPQSAQNISTSCINTSWSSSEILCEGGGLHIPSISQSNLQNIVTAWQIQKVGMAAHAVGSSRIYKEVCPRPLMNKDRRNILE